MDESGVQGNWADCPTEIMKAPLGTVFMRMSIHLINLNYKNDVQGGLGSKGGGV